MDEILRFNETLKIVQIKNELTYDKLPVEIQERMLLFWIMGGSREIDRQMKVWRNW